MFNFCASQSWHVVVQATDADYPHHSDQVRDLELACIVVSDVNRCVFCILSCVCSPPVDLDLTHFWL